MSPDSLQDPQSALAMANDGITANDGAIDAVLQQIISYCQGGIQANNSALSKVRNKITRTVNGVSNYQGTVLNNIIGQIQQSVVDQVSAGDAALNQVMIAATVGGIPPDGVAPQMPLDNLYYLYINCSTRAIAAFPTSNAPSMLAQQGWTIASQQTFTSNVAAIQWGQSRIAQLYAAVCTPIPRVPPFSSQPPGYGVPSGGSVVPGGSAPSTPTVPSQPSSSLPPVRQQTNDLLYLYWSCSGQGGVPGIFVIFDPKQDTQTQIQATISQYGLVVLEPFPRAQLQEFAQWIRTNGHYFLEDHGCQKGIKF